MQFTLYAIPALIALLAKVGMFFYARSSKVHNLQTRIYLLFLFCLSIQNLAELRFFVFKANGYLEPPNLSGSIYFCVSILAIAALLHLALIVGTNRRSGRENIHALGIVVLYTPVVVLEVLLWFTPLLINGFESMGYTYTRKPGSLFFLWEFYSIGYLSAAAGLFAYGAWKQVTPFRRLQNKFLLVGMFPIVAIVLTVVGLQHFGFYIFNATTTLPLAVTFFLAATAYTTHEHRLFDIAFYLPWSKVRKRKTAFYQRIQATIAEIAQLDSVQEILDLIAKVLRCPVALIGGPQPMLGLVEGQALAVAGRRDALLLSDFPSAELAKVDHILIAQEIPEALPQTFALMRTHRVAAIVPFYPHSQDAASWMLLGDSFTDQVYTPLDFRIVEELFIRIADRFLDRHLLLRSQVEEAQEEVRAMRRRLALSWDQSTTLHQELRTERNKNDLLEQRLAKHDDELSEAQAKIAFLEERRSALRAELLREQLRVVQPGEDSDTESPGPTFYDHVAEFETWLLRETLKRYDGDRRGVARELGLRPNALQSKIERYGLEEDDEADSDEDDDTPE